MKIAILTTYFFPEENGITRYIEGLYGALLEAHGELEVEVIVFDTLGTQKWQEKWGQFTIRRIESRQFMGRTYAVPTLKGYRQLKKIFNDNKYDIINTHTRFFFSSFLGIKFGKKYDIPVVHTEHGSGYVQHGNLLVELVAKTYDHTLGKYTLKNSKIVCGVSESVCEFAKKLGAKKVQTIYNGIDAAFWQENVIKNEIKKELGINDGEIVFSFVGRIVPSKGCQDVIEALEKVKNISWKFVVVGDGIFRKKLEEIVSNKKLEDGIVFMGMHKKEMIRNILQISDLFINASFASEGMPTTILEASAAGAKCLSSDMGGSVEILPEENLYTAKNIDELREKIEGYRDIKKINVSRFDWKNIQEKFYDVLKSV